MPLPKQLVRQSTAEEKEAVAQAAMFSVPKARTLSESAMALYDKLSDAGKEKWSILKDADQLRSWEAAIRARVTGEAGKRYFCYVRGMPRDAATKYVLGRIFSGAHAARCVSWDGKVMYGIPGVYAHGEPQTASRPEFVKTMQSLFADAGYRDKFCMDVLTLVWDDMARQGSVRLRPDKEVRSGPSAQEVLAMPKKDALWVVRNSCWMTGESEDIHTDDRFQSDQLRWMIAVSRLRVEMKLGVMRAFDPKAMEQTLYIGFEALEHGAKLRRVKRGEHTRYEITPEEFCTPREYMDQARELYQCVGLRPDTVEMAIMDLYSEFVNDLGVLSAYSVRQAQKKNVGLKYETSRKAPGFEFSGIARVSDAEAGAGTGMDPEREKLLEELLDERMKLGKAKKGGPAIKGISTEDMDRVRSRYESMTGLDD